MGVWVEEYKTFYQVVAMVLTIISLYLASISLDLPTSPHISGRWWRWC